MKDTLFDEIERPVPIDRGKKTSLFEIHNGADYPEIRQCRHFMQKMLNGYPSGHREEIISRIRSQDDTAFTSALFELIVYTSMKSLGYELQPHPQLPEGVTKSPDFKVISDEGSEFYLEVTTTGDQDDRPKGSDGIINSIYRAVNNLSNDDFNLMSSMRGYPTRQPKTRDMLHKICEWMGELDHAELRPIFEAEGFDSMPCFKWEFEGGHIEFTAIPYMEEYRGSGGGLLGTTSGSGGWRDGVRPLRNALNAKRTRYGTLDLPLLVAVNYLSPLIREDEKFDALLGTSHEYVEGGTIVTEREKDGVFNQGLASGRVLSGVWIFRSLNLVDLENCSQCFYFNPWTQNEKLEPLKALPCYAANGEMMEKTDGHSLDWLLNSALEEQ